MKKCKLFHLPSATYMYYLIDDDNDTILYTEFEISGTDHISGDSPFSGPVEINMFTCIFKSKAQALRFLNKSIEIYNEGIGEYAFDRYSKSKLLKIHFDLVMVDE